VIVHSRHVVGNGSHEAAQRLAEPITVRVKPVVRELTLSIVRPGAGFGPFHDAASNSLLIYNGEVCNYREIASRWGIDLAADETDGHFVLRVLVRFGPQCVTEFSGMFAFFLGKLSYVPNAVAAHHVITSIGPLVARTAPRMAMIVAGRSAPAELETAASGGPVRVKLDIADVEPLSCNPSWWCRWKWVAQSAQDFTGIRRGLLLCCRLREFGRRCQGDDPRRRIIALTSDHYVGHVPYGASKGALDRITLAAAHEFAYLGVRANVVNPGAVDTGWMSGEQRVSGASQTPLRRNGSPDDTADFVRFLCSAEGGWINSQLLKSNGGYS
jgi:NAD(P)-dependent dehydrogenase (short-subunit alcohol dehydrogenase family)